MSFEHAACLNPFWIERLCARYAKVGISGPST
jgi:hypothetical protein